MIDVRGAQILYWRMGKPGWGVERVALKIGGGLGGAKPGEHLANYYDVIQALETIRVYRRVLDGYEPHSAILRVQRREPKGFYCDDEARRYE